MRRTWTIIGVSDVCGSFKWYQSLLGLPETAPAHDYFGQDAFARPSNATLNVSRLGTLDVLSTGVLPLVTVRVFNDNGAAGTQGFVEPVVRPRDAAFMNAQVFLSQPHDPANFRMNIGVRTFELGATLSVLHLANGVSLGTVAIKTYSPNYFEQVGLQQFVDNLPPSPDGLLVISVSGGSAVIYGSTTDNRTNDSLIAIASRP